MLVQFAGTRRNARADAPGLALATQPLDDGRPADEVIILARRTDDERGVAADLRTRIAKAIRRPVDAVRVVETDSWPDHWSESQASAALEAPGGTRKQGVARLLELTAARSDRRAFYLSMASGTPAQWGALAAALVARNERVAFVAIARAAGEPAVWPVYPPAGLRASRPPRSLTDEVRELERLPRGSTVLLTGPTGTGKSRLAHRLHKAWTDGRASAPFEAMNCAALPEQLVEAELFGSEPGAFTDAKKSRKGRFVLSDQGTLFLDEFGELALPVQTRLLTALEVPGGAGTKRKVRPVGSARDVEFDAWVVLGTNRDLLAAARERGFRADLLGRVGTHWLMLPSLRDARWDIPRAYMSQLAEQATRYKVRGFALEYDAHDALFRFALDPASAWAWNYRDVAQSAARLAFRATGPAGRVDQEQRAIIDAGLVREETARLRSQWRELGAQEEEGAVAESRSVERGLSRLEPEEVARLRAALEDGAYDALDEVSRYEAFCLLCASEACHGNRAKAWRWLQARNAVGVRGDGTKPVSESDSFAKRWRRFSWRTA